MRTLCLLVVVLAVQAANRPFAEVLREARGGNARSQYIVGMMCMMGQGTKQNLGEAARWLEQSSQSGILQAKVALANLYDVGQGVALDTARADRLRQEAAAAGDPTARGQLDDNRRLRGQADFRRASVLLDLMLPAESLPYAKRSVAAGSANGQLLLGRAYHFGQGTPVNLAEAVRLYRLSSDGGLADGSRAYAYMHEFGLGVRVNRLIALTYYDLAASRGSALAKRAAANLRSPEYDRPQRYYGGDHPATGAGTCLSGYYWNGTVGDGTCMPRRNPDDPLQ